MPATFFREVWADWTCSKRLVNLKWLTFQRHKNEGLESLVLLNVFQDLLSVLLVEEQNLPPGFLHDLEHLWRLNQMLHRESKGLYIALKETQSNHVAENKDFSHTIRCTLDWVRVWLGEESQRTLNLVLRSAHLEIFWLSYFEIQLDCEPGTLTFITFNRNCTTH